MVRLNGREGERAVGSGSGGGEEKEVMVVGEAAGGRAGNRYMYL
jgi:hypothetical protein